MAAKKAAKQVKKVKKAVKTPAPTKKAVVAKSKKPAVKEKKSAPVVAPLKAEVAVKVPPKAAPAPTPQVVNVAKENKEALTAPSGPMAQKWTSLFKKAETIDSKPYNMKQSYEEKTAIVHKVLGWGYILANRNDRLEVLFKDGIKYLISNYK